MALAVSPGPMPLAVGPGNGPYPLSPSHNRIFSEIRM